MMSSGGPSMAKPGKRRVADDHTAADVKSSHGSLRRPGPGPGSRLEATRQPGSVAVRVAMRSGHPRHLAIAVTVG